MRMEEGRTGKSLVFSICAGVLVLLGAFAGAAAGATTGGVDDDGSAGCADMQIVEAA